VIISSRDAKTCQEAVDALNKQGPGSSYAIPADLGKEPECKRLAAEIAKKESQIDILVNNAGATWGAPLETYPESGWDKVMSLNLKSIFFLTRYLVPLLEESGKKSGTNARVINIGSIAGITVPAMEAYAYTSSKAALHHMSRVLAARLAPNKINVNAIAAGGFETKMMAGSLKNGRELIEAATSAGRLGSPSDIGGICIYLSSKASEWVTGIVIPVDGGGLLKASM